MPSSSQCVFGPFRLDPTNACLWCDAEAIVLPSKAFVVLHYLVTHPDRLVSKDELLDAVWPEMAITDAVLRVTREAAILVTALDDPRRLGRGLLSLSNDFFQRGVLDQAIADGERALALATAGGEVVFHALVKQSLGIA